MRLWESFIKLCAFLRKHSRKWLRMLASSVSSILTWPEESLPFIQDSSSECQHTASVAFSPNELWQERVLFNKQRVEDIKMNTVWPNTGVSAWKGLCSCVFVGNGYTFTLWQTLKCCGFNWAVENGLIFKGWWNEHYFYLYKMDHVWFLVSGKHMLT